MATSGIVRAVTGIVKVITSDGAEHILQIGDRIMSDEMIVTGNNGAVSIQMADGSNFDLGRNASTSLNDAFAETETLQAMTPQTEESALAEVAAIQQALTDDPNFDPTQLDPTAAGPTASGPGGSDDDGHTVIEVEYLKPEMIPRNGFETEGIGVVFPEIVEDFILNPQQNVQQIVPVSEVTVLAEDSALDETSGLNSTASGSLRINGAAPQSVELSAPGATWNSTSNTLEASDYSVFVDANGDYTFTLLNALQHPDGSGVDNTVEFAFSSQLTDATGNLLTTTFGVKVYDDGPRVVNHDGFIKNISELTDNEFSESPSNFANNNAQEVLSGLISYDLGLDGLGSVSFGEVGESPDLFKSTFNGNDWVLTSRGDELDFIVTDADGDNVQELHGFVDLAPSGWQGANVDRVVFSLQPTSNGQSIGEYELILHDVLDMPVVPATNLTFEHAIQQNVSQVIVYSDQTQTNSELLIEGFRNDDPVLENGFIGINDNTLNTHETISYKFGSVNNSGTIEQANVVNDVQLHYVNSDAGSDFVAWIARKDGAIVGNSSFFINENNASSNLGIHVDGGYDSLELRLPFSSEFQVSGLTYINQTASDALNLDLLFGFNATDNDTDSVAGEFSVVVGNLAETGLGQLLTTPASHIDSNLINNSDLTT
jgi:hypothetical protein